MTQTVQTEEGRMGRLVYGRIAPNEDLVQGLQTICQAQGVRHALVRVGLGSLVDACLEAPLGRRLCMAGPAVEVLSLFGEVRTEADGSCSAALCGVVVDAAGQVLSGRFVSGHNLVFATFEVTLEEWLPHVPTVAPTSAL
jgi:predicted DNA-binding protein with PD1-like motif